MATGKVKFFNESKGFGFIIDSATGNEIFVHISGVAADHHPIKENDEVEYNEQPGKKGPNAINVKKVSAKC